MYLLTCIYERYIRTCGCILLLWENLNWFCTLLSNNTCKYIEDKMFPHLNSFEIFFPGNLFYPLIKGICTYVCIFIRSFLKTICP